GERLPGVADRLHVGVAGDRPEAGVAGLGVPVHRRLPAQPVELVVGHPLPPRAGQEVDALQAGPRVGRRHRGTPSAIAVTTPRSAATATSSVTAPGSIRRIISSPRSVPMSAGPT